MAFAPAQFLAVLETIDKRIPLPDLGAKLRALSLPSSNSWKKTLASLKDVAEDPKITTDVVDQLNELINWIAGYLRYSAKAIFVHDLPLKAFGDIHALAADFESALPAANILSNHPSPFPGLLSKVDLPAFNGHVVLRKKVKTPNSISFIFSAIKEYQVREDIPLSSADVRSVTKLEGYSKVVGVRTALHEQIDIVRFRWGGVGVNFEPSVEFILDVTRPGGSLLNQSEILIRSKQYRSVITGALLGGRPGFKLPHAINLFPVIQKIYDSTEGNVCELGFVTMIGNSVKTEKMKRNSADLRSETWHAGAMNAIAAAPTPDTIDIYKLNVSWKIGMSTDEPVLSIPGVYRSLSTADIDHALIIGCTEKASFDFTYQRLMTFARLP